MLVRDQFTERKVNCLHIKVMVWISCKLTGEVSSTSVLRRLSLDRGHLPQVCQLPPSSASSVSDTEGGAFWVTG